MSLMGGIIQWEHHLQCFDSQLQFIVDSLGIKSCVFNCKLGCTIEGMMALMRDIIGGWEHWQYFLSSPQEFCVGKLKLFSIAVYRITYTSRRQLWWHSWEASCNHSTYNAPPCSYIVGVICWESKAVFNCKLGCIEGMMPCWTMYLNAYFQIKAPCYR